MCYIIIVIEFVEGACIYMHALTDHKSACACLQIGMKNTCME